MKFQCYTLGCKVNQYETQALERQLLALGHEQADRDCDLLIVNTCTVTAVADRKNRTLIRRLRLLCAAQERRGARAGCRRDRRERRP